MVHPAAPPLDSQAGLRLSGPAGALAGLGLAVVMVGPLLFLSKLAGFQFLAVLVGFVGAVYFGFAIASGTVKQLVLEFLVAGAFLAIGVVALWADAPIVLAVGYGAHGLWDLSHHPRAVTTPVRAWYPPFCIVFDVVVAGFVLAWLPIGGTT